MKKLITFISFLTVILLFTGCQSLDKRGFDIETKIHSVTKTSYDKNGFDFYGYNEKGYNENGFDKNGFDYAGFDKYGFDKKRIHSVTGTEYDTKGYNYKGYNIAGYNREGYNEKGFDKEGKPKKINLKFITEYFIKNTKVDGFSVDWDSHEASTYVANKTFYYSVPNSQSGIISVPVATELIVEYTTYSMNGFGHHSNENNKKIKVVIPYEENENIYEFVLK